MGVRHDEWPCDAGAHSAARTTRWYRVHTFPYGVVPVRPRHFARRAPAVGVGERGQRRPVPARVGDATSSWTGDLKPLSEFRFGQSVPESFVFSHGRTLPVRQQLLHGRVQHLPLRSRHRRRRGGLERGNRLLPSGAARRRPARRAELHGRGLRSGDHRPAADRGRQRDHVPRRRVAEKYPVVKTGRSPPPSTVDDEKLITPKGPYVPLRNLALANAYPVLQGYKNYVGIGYHFNFEDPLSFASLGITAAYTPTATCRATSAATSTSPATTWAGAARCRGTARTSTTCSVPTKRSRKGYAAKLGYDWIADLRRAAHARCSFSTSPITTRSTRCRARRTSTTDFTRLIDRRGRAPLHRRAALDRRGRRREGRRRGRWSCNGQPRQRRDHAAGPRHARLRLRAADPELVDLAAQRRRRAPTAIATTYGRELLLRRLRQQLRRRQVRSSATASTTRSRVSASTRSAGSISCARWSSGTCRRCVFESVGTPAFHLTWLRPAVFATALWTDPAQLDAAQELRERRRAGRPALHRPALVRHDAVGRLRGRLPGTPSAPGPSGWSRSRSCRPAGVACRPR